MLARKNPYGANTPVHGLFDLAGEGLIDGLLELFSGLFESLPELISFSGRGEIASFFMSEGGFARLFSLLGEGADLYWDYLAFKHITGGQGFGAWKNMGAADKEHYQHIAGVIKSHAFIGQQLEKFKGEEGVAEVAEAYKKLGNTLPDEELFKKAHRALVKRLHPDKNPELGEELMQTLNKAKIALAKDAPQRAAYEKLHATNPDKLNKIFELFNEVPVEEVYEKAAQAARKRLMAGPPAAGIGGWAERLSSQQKAGLAVGAIAGGAAIVYGIAHYADKKQKKHHPILQELEAKRAQAKQYEREHRNEAKDIREFRERIYAANEQTTHQPRR